MLGCGSLYYSSLVSICSVRFLDVVKGTAKMKVTSPSNTLPSFKSKDQDQPPTSTNESENQSHPAEAAQVDRNGPIVTDMSSEASVGSAAATEDADETCDPGGGDGGQPASSSKSPSSGPVMAKPIVIQSNCQQVSQATEYVLYWDVFDQTWTLMLVRYQ